MVCLMTKKPGKEVETETRQLHGESGAGSGCLLTEGVVLHLIRNGVTDLYPIFRWIIHYWAKRTFMMLMFMTGAYKVPFIGVGMDHVFILKDISPSCCYSVCFLSITLSWLVWKFQSKFILCNANLICMHFWYHNTKPQHWQLHI